LGDLGQKKTHLTPSLLNHKYSSTVLLFSKMINNVNQKFVMKNSLSSLLTKPPQERNSRVCLLGGLAAVALALGFSMNAAAQSDDFDSGALSAAWTKFQFFPQSYTFPIVGTCKGLRIQAAPVPNAAPSAAAIAQTNR